MMAPNDILEQEIKRENLLEQARYIQEGFSQFPQNMADEALLLVGPSGSGKSTLANYLLETPLIKWSIEVRDGLSEALKEKYKGRRLGHVYPNFDQEDRLDIPKIGSIGSTTRLITAYRAKSLLLIDTPGFNDTNNNRQLANALMLEQMISQSQKIKLAMVVDFNAIVAGQGNLFNDFTRLLSQLFFLEQLHNCLNLENILFIFMDKRGELIDSSRIREEIDCFEQSLELMKESAGSLDERNLLNRQIQICSIIKEIPDKRLIFVNPLDSGESRREILSAVEPMPPIDNTIFNFNTSKKIEFRSQLQRDFILPYLDLMRCERIRYERQSLDKSYRLKLLGYEQLPDTTQRRKKISEDLENEDRTLDEGKNRLAELKQKLNTAEQKLQNDLNPDEEIEYVTMTGDNRAYTLIEGSALAGLIGVGGYAGYSAFLTTYFASVGVSVVSSGAPGTIGLTVMVYGQAAAFGFAIIPVVGIFALALVAKNYTTAYVENTYDLEVSYIGACLTKTEIRNQEITAPDANSPVTYYEIDPDQIVISPDHRQCTAKYRKMQAQGTQQSQALCIIGKRENHPVFGRLVTVLRNEIAGLKTDIIGYESRVEVSEKFVSILKMLKNSTNESTLGNLLTTLNAIAMENEFNESLTTLKIIKRDIEAIDIILTYISVTDIFSDYQNEYEKLRKRHAYFAISSGIEALEKASIKHNHITYDADTFSSAPHLKKEDTETMTSAIEETNQQLSFINDLKNRMLGFFKTSLSDKQSSKRNKYCLNVEQSLNTVFDGTEFRQLIYHFYHSIPDSKIPTFREKEEYLVGMINHDKERIKAMYRLVKDAPIQTSKSEFSREVVSYIHFYWSELIVLEDKSDETHEEKELLKALHGRFKSDFLHLKPPRRNLISDNRDFHLTNVMNSLDVMFSNPSHRAEILGYYRDVNDTAIPSNERKKGYLLRLIHINDQKILKIYELAKNLQQDSNPRFAESIVEYIRDYWEPFLRNNKSFDASVAALTATPNGFFVRNSSDINPRTREHTAESKLLEMEYEHKITQIDSKMTVFKYSFIHFIDKTYRLFYVLVNEDVESTKADALKKFAEILRCTKITSGLNIPGVGSLNIDIPSVVAACIDLYFVVREHLDKIKMKQFCDAFPVDDSQRFNAIILAALKLSVELSPELYHMEDACIIVLAEVVVKRIVNYITIDAANTHTAYPWRYERAQNYLPSWIINNPMSPTIRKDITKICQDGMRFPMKAYESGKISHAARHNGPSYQEILDHSGRIIVQENEALIFTKPTTERSPFCMAQSPPAGKCTVSDPKILPEQLQRVVDVCAEVYQSEMNNKSDVIPANIFLTRRQQNATEVNYKVSAC